ncbi:hypothetical protein SAMN05216561_108147 [Nocardioides psychrotolerans]|uniref:Uncharacterized protein n=2 Tax=Nocardioides psychrotolerans TaxID=1005945 RepID=A0A1I3I7C0_9ACTN|nr:HGGxSTG domain-containing protein [Nocardioides psychrotolerans]SFI43831.1 hypothetical protein SAMN05216561_108147 [Nocardioides psychrotolerans]
MTQRPSEEAMQSGPPERPHAIVRDGHVRQCAARTRSGARCRSFAVEGMRVCRMHGGSSPQARAAAARRRAEAQAEALLAVVWDPEAAPVTNPVEALLLLAGKLRHATDVLGARLDGELDGTTALAWVRVMRELRQALEGIERLDLHSKQIAIAEDQGRLLAGVVRAVLDRLGLSDEQRALSLVVVPQEFRALGEPQSGQGR